MQGAGFCDGDILVVDRIAVLNGELTVKRLFRQGNLVNSARPIPLPHHHRHPTRNC
jgi:hypothetical protein